LAEVKHKGELKVWHHKPLAYGRYLQSLYTERTGRSPTPCCHHGATTCLPACRHTTLCSTGPPGRGGLQHYKTPAPNLPRRCRQTGLNAKGVTPELLRLKNLLFLKWEFLFSLFSFL
jgi:hypothetical protein